MPDSTICILAPNGKNIWFKLHNFCSCWLWNFPLANLGSDWLVIVPHWFLWFRSSVVHGFSRDGDILINALHNVPKFLFAACLQKTGFYVVFTGIQVSVALWYIFPVSIIDVWCTVWSRGSSCGQMWHFELRTWSSLHLWLVFHTFIHKRVYLLLFLLFVISIIEMALISWDILAMTLIHVQIIHQFIIVCKPLKVYIFNHYISLEAYFSYGSAVSWVRTEINNVFPCVQ